MTAPMLEVRSLDVELAGRKLVQDLSFSLDSGRTLALIGESGSGKSMTAAAVMGLLPPGIEASPRTRILLAGEPLPLGDERRMRALRGRRMGIVFQDPMSCLNPFMTAGRQIEESLERLGIKEKTARAARIAELLELVELPDPRIARRYPHELSGGQQQRVMIAMALAAEPDVLIADEPTSALDATVQAEILELLARVQQRLGTAILFITHDLAAAARLAQEIVVMQHGRAVEQGDAALIMSNPTQDYTRELVSVRRMLETPPDEAATEASAPPVLSVEHVSYDYPGRGLFDRSFRALDDVSLALAAGRTLGVLGESGSGKSTLASLIVGLAAPTQGDIKLFGQSLAASRFRMSREQRRRCQIIFQNPYGALNPRLTIEQAMREPIELLEPHSYRDQGPRLRQALTAVGLDADHLERYPHELSGGQRQRVCIARALLSKPDLLICDEIVSALDATVQMQVLHRLKTLQARLGFAMLFIGHDIEIVRWVSDEIAVMKDGRLVEHGPADRILHEPQQDYTRKLIAAMPTPLRLLS